MGPYEDDSISPRLAAPSSSTAVTLSGGAEQGQAQMLPRRAFHDGVQRAAIVDAGVAVSDAVGDSSATIVGVGVGVRVLVGVGGDPWPQYENTLFTATWSSLMDTRLSKSGSN